MSSINAATTFLVPIFFSNSMSLSRTAAVLATMSITFVTVRTVLAYYADMAQKRNILLGASMSAVFSSALYTFASSIFGFISARLVEGVRHSCFWAASRGAVIEAADGRNASGALVINSGVLSIGAGLGTILGMSLAEVSFDAAFMFLALLSAASGVVLCFYREKPKQEDRRHSLTDLWKRLVATPSKVWKGGFYITSFDLMINATLLSFSLPIFLKSILGLSFFQVGVLAALLYLSSGFIAVLRPQSLKRKSLFLLLCSSGHLVLFAIAVKWLPASYVILAVTLIGLGYGFAKKLFEQLIYASVGETENRNLHIAVMHIPLRLLEILAYIVAGLCAEHLGFEVVLVYPILFYFVFWVGCKRTLTSA